MKKFTNDLKKIFNGLAHQWHPDYLSTREKSLLLEKGGRQPVFSESAPRARAATADKKPKGQIAIVTDSRNLELLLDYVLKTRPAKCNHVDLLIHGSVDHGWLAETEKRLADAGLGYDIRLFRSEDSSTLIDYVVQNPSLLYLVSTPSDTSAKVFMDHRIPRGAHRMYVPLVLIDAQEAPALKAESVA